MRTRIIALLALAALGGCTWETYQNQAGQTRPAPNRFPFHPPPI